MEEGLTFSVTSNPCFKSMKSEIVFYLALMDINWLLLHKIQNITEIRYTRRCWAHKPQQPFPGGQRMLKDALRWMLFYKNH